MRPKQPIGVIVSVSFAESEFFGISIMADCRVGKGEWAGVDREPDDRGRDAAGSFFDEGLVGFSSCRDRESDEEALEWASKILRRSSDTRRRIVIGAGKTSPSREVMNDGRGK